MATAAKKRLDPAYRTAADLLADLGDVSAERVFLRPAPGTATEKDVIALLKAPDKRLCELVHGVLVEKAMGFHESLLAAIIIEFMGPFVRKHDRGIVVGADGAMRLLPGRVRIPDVSFISWGRLPGRVIPQAPIPNLAPDLAVEVLSESNTKREMDLKLKDFFQAGVLMAWLIQPKTQTAEVYTSPTQVHHVAKAGVLHAGVVLPGFKLSLKRLFAEASRGQRKR